MGWIIQIIAKGVPAILVAGGIIILILSSMLTISPVPTGLNPLWGWVLIIIGVLIYVFEVLLGVNHGDGGM